MYGQVRTFVCNVSHSEDLRQHSTIVCNQLKFTARIFPTESFTLMLKLKQAESFLAYRRYDESARTKCFDVPFYVMKMCESPLFYLSIFLKTAPRCISIIRSTFLYSSAQVGNYFQLVTAQLFSAFINNSQI